MEAEVRYMKKEIQIRAMGKDDFVEGALLMSFAFRDKLPSLNKFSDYEIRDFMLAGGLFSEHSLEGFYVAIDGNKVAGILHLDTQELHTKRVDAPLKIKYIIKKFGLIRSLIAGISVLFLDHHLEGDEMIVDYIAVHPDSRGMGIGGKLLDFGEEIAKNTQGINRYTLRVIGKNVGAKRLYERKGFETTKIRKQYIPRLFTGVKRYYSMEKKIRTFNQL